MKIKTISKRILTSGVIKNYTDEESVHIADTLAIMVFEGKLEETAESMAAKIKSLNFQGFEKRIINEEDLENSSVNTQIEYMYNSGKSIREISLELGKSYTRVKNIVKKMKDNE